MTPIYGLQTRRGHNSARQYVESDMHYLMYEYARDIINNHLHPLALSELLLRATFGCEQIRLLMLSLRPMIASSMCFQHLHS